MRSLRVKLFAAVLLAVLAGPARAMTAAGIHIEPAKTRVGLARVNLEIRDLKLDQDRLVGTYEVRIPLASHRNDRGNVEILLDESWDSVISNGGTLSGLGHSVLDGRTHGITCEFGSGNTVEITIDTGDRILAFKTRLQ